MTYLFTSGRAKLGSGDAVHEVLERPPPPLLRVTLRIGRGFIPLMFKTVPRELVHD